MTGQSDSPQQPATPTLHHKSGMSLVWLIPLITLLIGGWLVFKSIDERGPSITLTFETAEGIEVGTTRIKYKNVDVGVVESLRFGHDYRSVELTAQMDKSAEALLNRGTRFWVVRPRLSLREVSGLGTLISGAYIELDPGEGAKQTHFTGLETPPVLTTEDEGQKVLLMAPKLGSIGIGSPIYYQGIVAGEILGYELGDDQRSVLIHAFVEAPYNDLLRGNTRFWNVSGLDVSLDADGIKVHTESIESLMFGGIAFDTPATLEPLSQDLDSLVFPLHSSRESIEASNYTQKVQFLTFFDGSVRGLNINAPVEFKGIKVGSVKDIRLEFHADDTSFRIPVLLEIEPERIIKRGRTPEESKMAALEILIERGLRARLQTGSLLTGQLLVELVMRPETQVRLVDAGIDIPQIPTIPAELEAFTTSIKNFLGKLDKVDIDGIASELQQTLEGTNRLMNHAELDNAISDMAASLNSLKGILVSLESRSEPISANLQQALGAVAPALEQARDTMSNIDSVIAPESQLHFRVIQMADELAETARAIRSFVELLERNPESMIFGKEPPR